MSFGSWSGSSAVPPQPAHGRAPTRAIIVTLSAREAILQLMTSPRRSTRGGTVYGLISLTARRPILPCLADTGRAPTPQPQRAGRGAELWIILPMQRSGDRSAGPRDIP